MDTLSAINYLIFSRKKRSFTLIEILTVSALVAVIASALFFTFSSGMKIWEKVAKKTPLEELIIFYEKAEKDFKNTIESSVIPFLGKKGQVSFSAPVVVSGSQGKNVLTVGKVSYYFDVLKNTLERAQSDYSSIYQKKSPSYKIILSDIKRLNFEYYYYDPQRKQYSWKQDWIKEGEQGKIPQAIRINIELEKKIANNKMVKTIFIPIGKCCNEK